MKLINSLHEFRPEEEPTECPICHFKIVPDALNGVRLNGRFSQIVYKCNNPTCQQLFIATFDYSHIETLEPKKAKPIITNEDIKAISPSFYNIYNQANKAETSGLDEIAGVGYRKALEFLIKDYSCKENPLDEETIKSKPLMQVINTYMTDAPKVKSCATKAVWLGNDETHYIRKWEDKDIKDLKILINLTVHHIESEIMTAQFEADMT